ncbi:unnamed protein product [Pleuronectes platessa]|uniref:Uncharacterized protein n=1 Tax=Pleuronectes platessa TaxID=8262 RepID=A0A9N7VFQ5_PLEPL|nr:unnamed protein product [Pleuronectes platessa]
MAAVREQRSRTRPALVNEPPGAGSLSGLIPELRYQAPAETSRESAGQLLAPEPPPWEMRIAGSHKAADGDSSLWTSGDWTSAERSTPAVLTSHSPAPPPVCAGSHTRVILVK